MNFYNLLKGYPKYLFYSALNGILPHPHQRPNKKFLKVHQGDSCFILGSGPSIKNQDLTKLSGRLVMTQNNFHTHPDIAAIRPRYHVIVPKYQPEAFDNDWKEWLEEMAGALPPDCLLFADQNTKSLIEDTGCFDGRAYYTNAKLNALYMNRAVVDLTRMIMVIPTALTACLSIAIYMGFKRVYLTGFDLDQVPTWLRQGRGKLRFYGYSKITANDAEEQEMDRMEESARLWYWVWETWFQLTLLKNCADRHKVEVINCTDGGLLNIFPRQDYNAVTESV